VSTIESKRSVNAVHQLEHSTGMTPAMVLLRCTRGELGKRDGRELVQGPRYATLTQSQEVHPKTKQYPASRIVLRPTLSMGPKVPADVADLTLLHPMLP